MKKVLPVLAWLGATALLLYFLAKVNRTQLGEAMESVRWGWISAAIIANTLILVVWTALWWSVAPDDERPRYSTMFEVNAMASALMNTVPFGAGHVGAVVLMNKRAGLSRPGALSVMALDQLGEGLAKVALFAVVAFVAPIPEWMRLSVGTVCVAVGGLLLAMVIMAHNHTRIRPPSGTPLNFVSRARILAATWAGRMETLRSVKKSAMALVLAIGTKVAEGAALMAVQYAFGIELSIGATALVLAAVTLGSMLPIAPGNVGTYEAGAFLAYRHLGLDPGTATIIAVAAHACFMIPSVGIGYALGSWKVRTTVAA